MDNFSDFFSKEAILAFLVISVIIVVLFLLFLHKYRIKLRLRKFLYDPLPCSIGRQVFLQKKSLLDILFDIGLSLQSLNYLQKTLGWIPSKGEIDPDILNSKVSESVAKYGSYEAFVTNAKADLQGTTDNLSPEKKSKSIDIFRKIINEENFRKKELNFEKVKEEQHAFNSIFINLRDQTKNKLAKKLGITHRFDYLTAEVFRAVGESDKRRLVASLDPDKYLTADILQVFGSLSATGGGIIIGAEALDSVLDASFASDVDISTDTVSGDIGDLGEIALILGAITFTVGSIKKIGKYIKERNLRKFRDEFKVHMEKLCDNFFNQDDEQALNVPKLIINAIDMEKIRIEKLCMTLEKEPIDGDPKSNISQLSVCAAGEFSRIYIKMLNKFSKEINALLKNINRYRQNGRKDLAGAHLYINKNLVFLPSQLPEETLKVILDSQFKLIQEVNRLKK